MKKNIMGINFNNQTLEEITSEVINFTKSSNKGFVVTPNSEIAYNCIKDKKLLDIINSATFVLPDGIGVVYAGKITKNPVKTKVAGIELAENIIKNSGEYSVFLLGAKPGVSKLAQEKLSQKYPNSKIIGSMDGYFENDDVAIDYINKIGGADIIFVCLGSPRQELFMHKNINLINTKLLCGFGGVLDIFAENLSRAPKIFINLHLEWLYRLLKEPSRINRMKNLPLYIFSAIKERIS